MAREWLKGGGPTERPTSARLLVIAVVLVGLATASKEAQAQARELATVKSAELPVYSRMDATSKVVNTLMRGDLVEIDRGVTRAGSTWCKVTEIGGRSTSGYVRCEDVASRRSKPSEPLRLIIEEPTPKPMAKATEPEVKREGSYALQVASLVFKRNALTLKTRLEKLGFRPIIHMSEASITRHRVYGGEFRSRQEAEVTAGRLSVDGFPAKLVQLARGKFGLEVKGTFDLNEAIDLAHALQKKDYAPKIVSETTPTPVHQVLVGEYQNRAEALKVLEALKGQGFAPLIVRQ